VAMRVSRLRVLRPSHHCREDEEGNQSDIDDGGKEHVAGRGCWRTSLSWANKMVDAIYCM
jgi:hypothetical protein